jgi:hypothetical protein
VGLTIIGVGMGGAIRIVKAQDNAAPPTVTAVVVTPQAPETPQQAQDERTTSRELEDLLQQRAKLDARISELRSRMRSTVQPRVRVETRVTPRVEINPASPDWQRAVEDARQQARDAMQQAREAMRQAQEALREAQRAASRTDSSKGLFNAPAPRTPAPPNFNFDFKSDSNKGVFKMDPETMKRFQDQMKALDTQQQWMQRWKEMQPQFEQQMRDFQQRMQEWQRSFESQQRAMQKQLQQQFRNGDSFREKPTTQDSDDPKSSSSSRDKRADSDTDNEPL